VNREDIVAVLVRLFAVYMLFVVIRAVPALASTSAESGDATATIAIAASLVAVGLLTALLWFFPLTIARKLLPAATDSTSGTALGAPAAWSLAICALGLWVLTSALADAVYWIVFYFRTRELGLELAQYSPGDQAGMAATLVELALGVILTFGSTGLRALLFRLRYGAGGGAA
jgi:hypothetical protein